jgi:hypothetical protein
MKKIIKRTLILWYILFSILFFIIFSNKKENQRRVDFVIMPTDTINNWQNTYK